MKIIIAGDGKVGATLTRQLSSEGYDITLIDSNQSVLNSTVERFDVLAIHGNCASMPVLQEAGVHDAELLIAATSADEINLLCCMTAHGMNPDLHTIARIRNPEYTDQVYEMWDHFALSLAVNPEKQAAMEIERLLKYPGFLRRDTFSKGRVEIVELRVDEDSKLCNISLMDMNNTVGCKVLVCIVLRGGEAFAPDGHFVLKNGDRIFVTAPADALTIMLKSLGIITKKVKRVLLCGGGRVSLYLAQRLEKLGIYTTLIEQNYDRCLDLATKLPNTTIIHGDASSQDLLESEGLSACDALISLTGLDELNMIISLFGKSRKVPQTVTKLSRVEQSHILDSLPLGSVVCPKELCCNTIVRYVRAMENQTGAAVTVHAIADGRAEAVEFLVDESTKFSGVPLKDIKLKPNVLVVCITEGATTEIPSGNSTFKIGDTIVIVTSSGVVIHQLNDIFQ